jgi:hypothetical protein
MRSISFSTAWLSGFEGSRRSSARTARCASSSSPSCSETTSSPRFAYLGADVGFVERTGSEAAGAHN